MSENNSTLRPGAFKEVDIQVFRNATRDITFDVFMKLSEGNVCHVFSRSTGLDYKRLAQYIQKGVTELLIRVEDESAFDAFVSKSADSVLLDPNTPPERKIATLLNMTEQNMSEVFAQLNINEETAQNTKKLINNYVNLMTENPKTLATILKLASHGEYLYYHSIAVAIFSMFIGKATGQFNQRMLELIGLGGFLHDIGSTKISKDIVCSPSELTSAQWQEMRAHPKLGLFMIEGTPNIPDEVRYIVYQHHEEPNGKGYPNGLMGDAIYYPARVVAVADAFSALISRRPYRPPYTVEQAIHILQNESGKYDRELVRILASVFLRQAKSDSGESQAA